LLDAALAEFSEKGVDATTIEDITEEADVGKGTFYRHFESKRAVVLALIEDVIGRLIERIRSFDRRPQTLPEMLEHLARAHVDVFTHNPGELFRLFQGRLLLKVQRDPAAGLDPPYLAYLEELQRQLAPHLAPPVDAAKVRRLAGALAGCVSGALAFAMLGMPPGEVEVSLEPLRRAFVAGASAFLERQGHRTLVAESQREPGR
jgi:AcrR family transcriptional regulator